MLCTCHAHSVLQSGVLPKSCLEVEVKEVHAAHGSRFTCGESHCAQVRVHEQDGDSSGLLFSVDTRADVKVSPPAFHDACACTQSSITLFQCSRLTVTAIRDALVLLIIQP